MSAAACAFIFEGNRSDSDIVSSLKILKLSVQIIEEGEIHEKVNRIESDLTKNRFSYVPKRFKHFHKTCTEF